MLMCAVTHRRDGGRGAGTSMLGNRIARVVAGAWLGISLPLLAQDDRTSITTTKTEPTRDATTSRVISSPEVKENLSPTATDQTRPSNLAGRTALSTDVRERLRAFERAREMYLRRQRELEKRLKGATEEEREKIREQLKDRRTAWLEQHRQFKSDLRDRVRELRRELPALRDAIDEQPRPRPGLD